MLSVVIGALLAIALHTASAATQYPGRTFGVGLSQAQITSVETTVMTHTVTGLHHTLLCAHCPLHSLAATQTRPLGASSRTFG